MQPRLGIALSAASFALPIHRSANRRADCNANGNPNCDIAHGGTNPNTDRYSNADPDPKRTNVPAKRWLFIFVGHAGILYEGYDTKRHIEKTRNTNEH